MSEYLTEDEKDDLVSSLQSEVERLKKEKDENYELARWWTNAWNDLSRINDSQREEIERLKASSEWARVEDKMPAVMDDLLLWDGHFRFRGFLSKEGEFQSDKFHLSVTHWMPLPHPPDLPTLPLIKEEGEKKEECSHENTKLQQVRCTVCSDCGEIIETDV